MIKKSIYPKTNRICNNEIWSINDISILKAIIDMYPNVIGEFKPLECLTTWVVLAIIWKRTLWIRNKT